MHDWKSMHNQIHNKKGYCKILGETHLKECKIGRDDTNLFAMKIKKGVEVNLGLGTHYELHMDNVLSFVDVTLEMLL